MCSAIGGFFSGGAPLGQRARSRETPSSNRPRGVRPASIARIVQRRAAIQNRCRCAVQQNFCADPPVARGVNVRAHHKQRPSGVGFPAGSSTGVGKPLPFIVNVATDIGESVNSSTNSKVSTILPFYPTRPLVQEIPAVTLDQLFDCRKSLSSELECDSTTQNAQSGPKGTGTDDYASDKRISLQ
jgi:hypothetical protein